MSFPGANQSGRTESAVSRPSWMICSIAASTEPGAGRAAIAAASCQNAARPPPRAQADTPWRGRQQRHPEHARDIGGVDLHPPPAERRARAAAPADGGRDADGRRVRDPGHAAALPGAYLALCHVRRGRLRRAPDSHHHLMLPQQGAPLREHQSLDVSHRHHHHRRQGARPQGGGLTDLVKVSSRAKGVYRGTGYGNKKGAPRAPLASVEPGRPGQAPGHCYGGGTCGADAIINGAGPGQTASPAPSEPRGRGGGASAIPAPGPDRA